LMLSIAPVLGNPWGISHAWHRFGGLQSGWPLRRPEFHSELFDNDFYGSSWRKPCPEHKPMRASEWQLDSNGQMLVAEITLPDVFQRTVRATLDNSVIRVKGLRERLARRSCLPEDAEITDDGQYEVLRTVISIPAGGITQKVQMQNLKGKLRFLVPFTAPCPRYEPARVSDWEVQSSRLTLDVTFPKVEQRTLRTWLDAEESVIRISGLRSIHRRDRDCLPESSRFTADGRHEILEVAVPLPKGGIKEDLTAQRLQGGLRLFMPLKSLAQASPKPASYASISASDAPTKFTHEMHRHLPKDLDVIVEDVTYDWPEKEIDASEGYFDSRGDFYEY